MKTIRRNWFKALLLSALLISVTSCGSVQNSPFDGPDEYRAIREVLANSDNSRVLAMSPDLLPAYYPWNDALPVIYPRVDPVKEDPEMMMYASFGDSSFANYLISKNISHVLVPTNDDGGYTLKYKWGRYPSVSLDFSSPYFEVAASASGQNAATLLRVVGESDSQLCLICVPFEIEWRGMRPNATTQVVDPFAKYDDPLRFSYEDGSEFSWVYGSESPRLVVRPLIATSNVFQVSISVSAAYGANPQPQLVEAAWRDQKVRIVPSAQGLQTIVATVSSGEDISLSTKLPCTVPAYHESGNPDTRRLCYGIVDVRVTQATP